MVDRKKRTHYFIATQFQIRFALLLIGVGVLVTAIVGLILYFVLNHLHDVLVNSNVLSLEVVEFLEQQNHLYTYSLLGTFIGVTLVLFILGIFVSHRLAGPIFALTRRMNDLAQGNFNVSLTLRKSDEFQEVKDKFNHLVKALQNQVSGELIKMNSAIETLRRVLSQKDISQEHHAALNSVYLELQSFYNYKKSLIEPSSLKNVKPAKTEQEDVLI